MLRRYVEKEDGLAWGGLNSIFSVVSPCFQKLASEVFGCKFLFSIHVPAVWFLIEIPGLRGVLVNNSTNEGYSREA